MIEFNRSITIVNHFSHRLRQARLSRGMSQAALARASGVSQGAISNYENGTRRSAKEIFRLAEALRVDPVWLSTGAGSMEGVEPSHNLLSEATPGASSADAWPFNSIAASTYWSLEPEQRALIEHAVAGIISAFRKESRE